MILNGMKIEGRSIAGEETNIRLPNLNMMFDLGFCNKKSISIPNLFITHCHPDHYCGFVNYLFLRKLHNLPAPNIYAPLYMINPMKLISKTVSALHSSEYPASFIPISSNQQIKIKDDVFIKAINATHCVEANCYLLYMNEEDKIPQLAYTGDTTIEILDLNDILYYSKILIIEATFLGDDSFIDKAINHKHIHLNQIYERADLFQNDYIILTHSSSRYSKSALAKEIAKAPIKIRDKIKIFP